MSWNSSTMIERKRRRSRSRTSSSSRQEIPGAQLEVLEVERALRVLRALVRVAEELEQLLEQVAVAHGGHVQRGLLERQSRVLVGRETLLAASLDRKDGEIEQ